MAKGKQAERSDQSSDEGKSKKTKYDEIPLPSAGQSGEIPVRLKGDNPATTEPADSAMNEIKEDDRDLSKEELTKRLTEVIGWTKTNSQTCLRAARLGGWVEDGRNGFKLSLH